MPPVRWKRLAATTMCLVQVIIFADAQVMQDAISMTSDGWRPIIGTPKIPPYPDEILHYRNQNGDSIKADTPVTTIRPPPSTPSPKPSPKPVDGPHVTNTKVALHSKPPPGWTQTALVKHAPHIPLGAVTHGPQNLGPRTSQVKKFPTSSKPYLQVSLSGKRHIKPIRIQPSHSSRDEIFLGSHSQNPYVIYKQGQNTIKTREAIGLGLPGGLGSQHFSVNHGHIDFSNRFVLPPTSESVFQQYSPVQSYIFSKPAQTNDINFAFQRQSDDFTRNLVPPPLLYKEKPLKNIIKDTLKPQVLVNKGRTPEKVVVQLPPPVVVPPFEFNRQKGSESPVEVQITKEKFNVFQNNIPVNYNGDYVDYNFHSIKRPITDSPKIPTYEVTEGNSWQHDFASKVPLRPSGPTRSPEVELNLPPFLPTPYRPEGQGIVPTSPTQDEVSTIFTKLSKLQREQHGTQNPYFFNVKEVSTHYPILGKPIFEYEASTQDISNDITTVKPDIEEIVTAMKEPQRSRPHRRRRPNLRHRTTTTTSTTEEPAEMESYELQKTQEYDSVDSSETERPIRQRRPTRYRSTTPRVNEEKVTRTRNRYKVRPTEVNNNMDQPVRKRVRPTKLEITEMPANHKTDPNFDDSATEMSKEVEEASDEVELYKKNNNVETEAPEYYAVKEESKTNYETILHVEEETTTTTTTPTGSPSTTRAEEDITTVESTTTTTTTAKPSRVRGRPIKYDSSSRPRFSVKDYRQKLNPYSASTTTTESYRTTSESLKVRFPSRGRRPSTTTTMSAGYVDEDSTEPVRSKFVPKEPRHGSTTEDAVIADKNVKAVNTRLRTFGRYRSTTATTASPKMSAKPNLFAKRRRLPPISLKTRLYNRNKTITDEKITTTEENQTEQSTVNENYTAPDEPVTDNLSHNTDDDGMDVSRNDPHLLSQRISDLTSSAKNEFKSVPPSSSRRIPNYFTIATDDPILPIEAFFPNIKDSNRNRDKK